MSGRQVSERKQAYRARLLKYMAEYKSVMTVNADNVGSHQLQKVRMATRGRAVVLMGKNTMIRNILRSQAKNAMAQSLLRMVNGNVGFVFTNDDLSELRKEIESVVEPAGAKPGSISPVKVVVPAGPTGMDPGQTSFFQAMSIPTKIVRGQVEIVSDVNLLEVGDKVGNSESTLLSRLDIKPFHYGLRVVMVYNDGSVYGTDILDMTTDALRAKFLHGVRIIAALGLRIGYPTLATIPHSFANALKKLLAISVATDYTFEQSEDVKLYLNDPDAWAEKHGVTAGGGGGAAADEAPKEEDKPADDGDDSDGSSSGGDVGGLFGGSDSD